MERNSMNIPTVNQHVIHNTNHHQAEIIYSSAGGSSQMRYFCERPMMLNTWTQTSNADLGISDDYINIEQQKQREKELLEKIRDLESKLRIQSEMLSQQPAGGRRRNSNPKKARSPRQRLQEVIVDQIPVQLHENHPQDVQNQQHEQYTETKFQIYNTHVSPRNVHCEELSQAQISPQHQPEQQSSEQQTIMQSQYMSQNMDVSIQPQELHIDTIQDRPRKVNYTIIADGGVNGQDGPIEIEIAEEENGLNLNGSADSDRLEICLAEEQPQTPVNVNYIKIDNDAGQNQQIPVQKASGKRKRKVSKKNIVQNTDKNNGDLAEFKPVVSDYSQFSENSEMSQQQQLIVADDNHSILPILQQQQQQLSEITNDVQEFRNSEFKKNSYISIGPNNTRVPTKIYDSINWENASMATRKLMIGVFDRFTLATHSMTGKPSPAFKDHNKPLKKRLNPLKVQDIIFAVSRRSKVNEKEVRTVITTKCADENKMWKLTQAKLKEQKEQNKENVANVQNVQNVA
ncbi:protein insensitive [Bactrocera dorsalis]|uniref:Protein insensitive n=1 Tax=Bactrocera dorsalis TaxID=27457 RepID=A0A6I9W6A0_BACDO|nr:protein insensitive [Bactrocera dorsalis]XP_019848236.2 protein insensitive [Bactrocera dorsalis]